MHWLLADIGKPDRPLVALLIQLMPGRTLTEAFEQVYRAIPAEDRLRAAAIIVRFPVADAINPSLFSGSNEERNEEYAAASEMNQKYGIVDGFVARFRNVPVFALFSCNYTIHLSQNLNADVPSSLFDSLEIDEMHIVAALKAAELDYLIEKSRAQLPSAEGVFYQAPSKRVMRTFLRVGNIQFSRAALDAVFFWLIPHLEGCVGILTDTWSISSIALNLSHRLAEYSGGRPCSVEMMDQYHDGSDARAMEAASLIEDMEIEGGAKGMPGDGKIIVLISATQTGSLVSQLRASIGPEYEERLHFIALFKLGSSHDDLVVLRDLSFPNGEGQYAAVNSGYDEENLITIDEQIYFPVQFKDIHRPVRASDALQAKNFLMEFSSPGLVKCHFTCGESHPPRHHAVYVDTQVLASNESFVRKWESYFSKLNFNPRCIIHPPHRAAETLKNIAMRALNAKGHNPPVFSHPSLSQTDIDDDLRNTLQEVSHDDGIVILDDAFITGARLTTYQTSLRNVSYRGFVNYVVAIARPADLNHWKFQRRMLAFRPVPGNPTARRNNTDAIQEVVLPNWSEKACPWCSESNALRKIQSLDGILLERSNRLSTGVNGGLELDAFFNLPGRSDFRLSPQSLFAQADACASEVFMSVASAIQHARTSLGPEGQPLLGQRRYPFAVVFPHEEYLKSVYTEEIVRAALVRALRPDDLVYTTIAAESERTANALRVLQSDDPPRPTLFLEFLVAQSVGKFPFMNRHRDAMLTVARQQELEEVWSKFITVMD